MKWYKIKKIENGRMSLIAKKLGKRAAIEFASKWSNEWQKPCSIVDDIRNRVLYWTHPVGEMWRVIR